MENGWHLAIDIQSAVQRRYTTSTYEPLKYGIDNDGKGYKKYTGKSFVPVLPHLDLVYKHNNWFGSFHSESFPEEERLSTNRDSAHSKHLLR